MVPRKIAKRFIDEYADNIKKIVRGLKAKFGKIIMIARKASLQLIKILKIKIY